MTAEPILAEVIHEGIEILLRRLALTLAHADATAQPFERIGGEIGVDIEIGNAIQLLHIFLPTRFGLRTFGHFHHLSGHEEHRAQFQQPRGEVGIEQTLILDRRVLQTRQSFGRRQQTLHKLFQFVGMAGLEASNGLLHVFGIVPSEVRNERLIGVLLFGGAENSAEAGVP